MPVDSADKLSTGTTIRALVYAETPGMAAGLRAVFALEQIDAVFVTSRDELLAYYDSSAPDRTVVIIEMVGHGPVMLRRLQVVRTLLPMFALAATKADANLAVNELGATAALTLPIDTNRLISLARAA